MNRRLATLKVTLFRKSSLCVITLALLLACLGTACGQTAGTAVLQTPTPATVSQPPEAVSVTAIAPVTQEATATSEPTWPPPPSPAATQTPSPSPAPSSTPLPIISLSVPPSWRERATSALNHLNSSTTYGSWRLVDPIDADVQLLKSEEGIFIAEAPIVLAVPFTSEWESTTLSEAQTILQENQQAVDVIPWEEMAASQKSLRIDGLGPADDDYPLQETWSLVAQPGFQEAAQSLAPLLQQSETGVVHLAAVGDIMLDRSLGMFLERGDLHYPFTDVSARLLDADITAGNVESALGDSGEPEQKRYPFRAPPEAAEALDLAGFDIVSLANNHGMDYGPQALLQAVDLLQNEGIAVVGAGAKMSDARAAKVFDKNGVRIAFLGYVHVPVEASTGFDTASWTAGTETPGIAWADPQLVAEDVRAARDETDLVVVLLHSGYEYLPAPSEPQQEAARAAVDAGADLVIGHHAHILQGIEFYRDGVIVYGTGNFAFDITGPPETAIFHIWLDRDGIREIAVEPAIVQFGGKPRLAHHWEAPAIRNRVYHLTNLLMAQ